MKIKILFAASFLVSNPFFAAQKVFAQQKESGFREDGRELLQQLVCGQDTTLDAYSFTQKLWKLGLYDAQVDFGLAESLGAGEIDSAFLESKAKALKAKNYHSGYSYGSCSGKKGWYASFPASKPIQVKDAEILFPMEAIMASCGKIQLDYADFAGGKAETLKFSSPISVKSRNEGVLSLTCWPTEPSWIGPQLWFSIPKGNFEKEVPFAKVLSSEEASFGKWINSIREKEGLQPISFGQQKLIDSANMLFKNQTVNHDHSLLQTLAESLRKEDNLILLGENRVIAQSNIQRAWLFWNSPRHRNLLLEPQATHGTYVLQESVHSPLMIVLLAYDATKHYTKSTTN